VSKSPEKPRILGWLSVFLILPESVWLTASLRSNFRGKSPSNVVIEPIVVAFLGIMVFVGWFLVSRKGLRPSVGLLLLILLSAAALALHRLVPGLRE
jgi:hypothetical protein